MSSARSVRETAAVLDEAADDFARQMDSEPAGVEVDAKALLAELQDPLAGVGGVDCRVDGVQVIPCRDISSSGGHIAARGHLVTVADSGEPSSVPAPRGGRDAR